MASEKTGPVFSVASMNTKRKDRYFYAVWRSAADPYNPRGGRTAEATLDVVDPIASGWRTSRAEAVAAALEVAPNATELPAMVAQAHPHHAKSRDRAKDLATKYILPEIERSARLLAVARSRDARRLLQFYNLERDTLFGYESSVAAFAYAIRLLFGEATKSDSELAAFAFVDDLVASVMARTAKVSRHG